MNLKKIQSFFYPSKIVLLFFLFFVFIIVAGSIQAWAFSKDAGAPKPVFYDLLAPFPFWVIWIYLSLPLFAPLVLLGSAIGFSIPEFLFLPLNLAYFYFLSCVLAFVVRKIRGGKR